MCGHYSDCNERFPLVRLHPAFTRGEEKKKNNVLIVGKYRNSLYTNL